MSRKKGDKIESPFKFKGNDGKIYKITLKEKLFCETYLETRGSGVDAALRVYNCKNRQVAWTMASQELIKPQIIAYIDLKLEEYGFTDENVKKQHLFTLNQFQDLGAKNKAVDMFYKLKGTYAPEQIKHSLDEDDIEERIREVKARIGAIGASEKKDSISEPGPPIPS